MPKPTPKALVAKALALRAKGLGLVEISEALGGKISPGDDLPRRGTWRGQDVVRVSAGPEGWLEDASGEDGPEALAGGGGGRRGDRPGHPRR